MTDEEEEGEIKDDLQIINPENNDQYVDMDVEDILKNQFIKKSHIFNSSNDTFIAGYVCSYALN